MVGEALKPFIKTDLMLKVEHDLGEPINEYLRRRFVDDHVNINKLADELGIAYRTLLVWLEVTGIYSRRLGICTKSTRENR